MLVDLYRDLFPEEPEGTGRLPALGTSTEASQVGTVDAEIQAPPWRTRIWWIAGAVIVIVVSGLFILPILFEEPKRMPAPKIVPAVSVPESEPDPEPPVGEGIGEPAPIKFPKEAVAPGPKPTGRLFLNAIPWAKVYKGKKLLGDTPIEDLRLPIGKHKLRLVNDEHKKTVYVVIRKGKITRKTFDMKEK